MLFALAFALGDGAMRSCSRSPRSSRCASSSALTPIRPADHWALVMAFYVIIPLQYVLIAGGNTAMFTVFIPVYVFLTLPVLMALRQNVEHYLQRIAKVQWGLMISVYCVSHAPAIAALEPPGSRGAARCCCCTSCSCVQMADPSSVIFSATLRGTQLRSNRTRRARRGRRQHRRDAASAPCCGG